MEDRIFARHSVPTFRNCYFLQVVSFLSLLFSHSLALASDSLLNDWELTGFGTLGYTDTSKYDDLVIKRNITQRSKKIENDGWLLDSSLGLQVRKELELEWDVVGQFVAKEKVNNSLENSIEMAFLRYRSNDGWSFQLGRMVLDTFLLSDHRDVGYSYHTVRPQAEFYAWIPFSHYDGFKTSIEFGDFDNLVRFEAFAGKTKATVNIGYLDTPTSYNYVKAAPIIGTGITWETGDFTLRASIARFRFTQNTAANKDLYESVIQLEQLGWAESREIADAYAIEGRRVTYSSIGFHWTPSHWLFQGEVSDVEGENFGNYDGQRAYLQIGYRFGEWLPHMGYSYSRDERDFPFDRFVYPDGHPASIYQPVLDGAHVLLSDNLSSAIMDQRSFTLGVRWDFASQKALKLQCDFATIDDNSLGIYSTPDTIDGEKRNWEKASRSWCSTTFDWVF